MDSDWFGTWQADLTMTFQPAGSEGELSGGVHWRTRTSSEVSIAALQMQQRGYNIETAQL